MRNQSWEFSVLGVECRRTNFDPASMRSRFSSPILAGLGYAASVASRFDSPVTFRGPGFGSPVEPIYPCFRVRFPNGVFATDRANGSPIKMQFSNLLSPNKALQPTITSVTVPARAGTAPAALVADL